MCETRSDPFLLWYREIQVHSHGVQKLNRIERAVDIKPDGKTDPVIHGGFLPQ